MVVDNAAFFFMKEQKKQKLGRSEMPRIISQVVGSIATFAKCGLCTQIQSIYGIFLALVT